MCLEEICILDFSDHPHHRWCFTQRWGSAALLSALQVSLLQGNCELISSFYSLKASASGFCSTVDLSKITSEQEHDISIFSELFITSSLRYEAEC